MQLITKITKPFQAMKLTGLNRNNKNNDELNKIKEQLKDTIQHIKNIINKNKKAKDKLNEEISAIESKIQMAKRNN